MLVLTWSTAVADAQLQVLPKCESQCFFADGLRTISVVWSNHTDNAVTVPIKMRIYQASSEIAAAWGDPQDWKQLQVLPHQVILEKASVTVPPVKAVSRFIVQWLGETNKVFGTSELMIYPTNLLDELKPLLGEHGTALGVLDPANQIKPVLKNAGIGFADLDEGWLGNFSGRLVLIGPCTDIDQEWTGLAGRIRKLSARGNGVVWIQALPEKNHKLWPSFFAVPHGARAVVIAQPAVVENLAENPQSQLNLVYFCKLALQAQPLVIPDLSSNP